MWPSRRVQVVGVVSAVLFAGWSIWWQRDFMARRAAVWQAAQSLVNMGIPAEEMLCGGAKELFRPFAPTWN